MRLRTSFLGIALAVLAFAPFTTVRVQNMLNALGNIVDGSIHHSVEPSGRPGPPPRR